MATPEPMRLRMPMTERSISSAVQDAALGDQRALDVAAFQLRRGKEARVGVDGVLRVVEIKRRDRVAQRQVGLEVGLDGPDVLPVAAVDVGLHALARNRVRDHVAPEVDQLRVRDAPAPATSRLKM